LVTDDFKSKDRNYTWRTSKFYY